MSWVITPEFKNKGLLDAYSGAAAAYSLRNLSILQNPYVVRVRRSSDNTEQDFTAAQVTDGTLTTFCGAGNGFVRTWYDQSGNGRNATQTTTANQPQIVSSGSLLTDNSKPCLQFNGSSTLMDANALASVVSGTDIYLSATSVCKSLITNPVGVRTVFGFGLSTSDLPLRHIAQGAGTNSGILQERDNAAVLLTSTGGTITSQSLIFGISDTNTQVLRFNGSQVATQSSNLGLLTANQFSIGCLPRTANTLFWDGNVQEIVLYQSNQTPNVAAIESNINAHYSIY
jgi:prepilin-type processing-associated H-X9-DG protein